MAPNPTDLITVSSIPIEIPPTKIAAAIINSAKNTRLYNTRSRTASRNVFNATTPARLISHSPQPPPLAWWHKILFQRSFHLRHRENFRARTAKLFQRDIKLILGNLHAIPIARLRRLREDRPGIRTAASRQLKQNLHPLRLHSHNF